jgi:hypothetical protein
LQQLVIKLAKSMKLRKLRDSLLRRKNVNVDSLKKRRSLQLNLQEQKLRKRKLWLILNVKERRPTLGSY